MSKTHYVVGPAVLLSVVVAVIVATEALTYYIGRHIIEQSRVFVLNSPPVQQGSAHAAESARPVVNTAMSEGSGPAARDVTPAPRDSRQPPSSGQAVISVVSVDERIAKLLEQAGEALSEDRLTIPAHRNAYSYYQQVLSQEPGNTEAHDGLEKIVERYVTLTRHAIRRGDKIKANQYITRALRVRPGDRLLLAMKDSINTMFASTSSEPVATPLKSPQQEEEAPRNIFQRLRDFFIHHVPSN